MPYQDEELRRLHDQLRSLENQRGAIQSTRRRLVENRIEQLQPQRNISDMWEEAFTDSFYDNLSYYDIQRAERALDDPLSATATGSTLNVPRHSDCSTGSVTADSGRIVTWRRLEPSDFTGTLGDLYGMGFYETTRPERKKEWNKYSLTLTIKNA